MIIFVFAVIAVVVGFVTGSVFIGGIVAAAGGAIILVLLGIGTVCEWVAWRKVLSQSRNIT